MKKQLSQLLFFVLVLVVFACFTTTIASAEAEYAIFPAKTMNVNQLAYESYSHGSQNAIDILPDGNVFAPFTGKVIFTDPQWGYVVLQSTNPVYWADGSLDYMTVGFMHDNDISDIEVIKREGKEIKQGEDFYQAGGTGWGDPKAFGSHVHIAVFRGKQEINNSNGSGDSYAFDAFFISSKTTKFDGKERGTVETGNQVYNNAPTDYSNRWRDLRYISNCTFYQSTGTATIIGDTYIKTLPCSSKTNSASIDVTSPKKGSILTVNGLYMNSAGNYWYRVTFNGRYGFLFAGNAEFSNERIGERNAHSYYSVTGSDLWCFDDYRSNLVRTSH